MCLPTSERSSRPRTMLMSILCRMAAYACSLSFFSHSSFCPTKISDRLRTESYSMFSRNLNSSRVSFSRRCASSCMHTALRPCAVHTVSSSFCRSLWLPLCHTKRKDRFPARVRSYLHRMRLDRFQLAVAHFYRLRIQRVICNIHPKNRICDARLVCDAFELEAPCSPNVFLQGVTRCRQMLYHKAVTQRLQGAQIFSSMI